MFQMRPIFRNFVVKQVVSKTLDRVIETYDEVLAEYATVKIKVKVTLVQALRLCTGRTAHRELEV